MDWQYAKSYAATCCTKQNVTSYTGCTAAVISQTVDVVFLCCDIHFYFGVLFVLKAVITSSNR